jgi:hypothetical protein
MLAQAIDDALKSAEIDMNGNDTSNAQTGTWAITGHYCSPHWYEQQPGPRRNNPGRKQEVEPADAG